MRKILFIRQLNEQETILDCSAKLSSLRACRKSFKLNVTSGTVNVKSFLGCGISRDKSYLCDNIFSTVG